MKSPLFYLISLTIIIADQVSKWAIIRNLPLNASKPIIGSFFSLTYTQNTGGAFSLFPAGNSTFVVVAVVAVGALIYAYHRYQRTNLLVSAALALALGGAIGNLIDRLRYGFVIDFFDVHAWINQELKHWPVFNIADSAISVGIVLLAGHFLFSKENAAEKKPADKATETTPSPVVSGQASSGDSLVADD